MSEGLRGSDVLRSRDRSGASVQGSTQQEFIVSFSPAGTLRCRIANEQTGQPRPFLFGRGETESFPASLEASRIIASPEGSPTGAFAAAWPAGADATIRVSFYCDGAMDGDAFVYRMEDGTELELKLYAVVDNNPTQIYSTTVTDGDEHSAPISIPRG